MSHQNSCSVCLHPSTYVYAGSLIQCSQCGITRAANLETTVVYDKQYVAERYDRYTTTEQMSHLRLTHLQYVLYLHEVMPEHRFGAKKGRLLDVGYGNGSFIRRCLSEGWDAWGHDVNPTPYEEVRPVTLRDALHGERWRVVTFFDSLEHFEDLSEIRAIVGNTDWIVISAPLPPSTFPASAREWKHYRPGEHHSYFSAAWSYEMLFQTRTHEAKVRSVGTPEDHIRGKLEGGLDNVLTVMLSCREKR